MRPSRQITAPPHLHLRRHHVDRLLAIDDRVATVEPVEDAEAAAHGVDLGDGEGVVWMNGLGDLLCFK